MTPLPVIAIVGRPNVGKSTLFNRLTRTRAALVSDLPGLTRDRKEGRGQVALNPVTVVDTAGLEEAPAGTIPARMREQTETAIAQSDLVLFVVDARDGITPADEAFARIVRAAGRPTVLVANKCEGKRGIDGLYEAFALGLGDPVAISAEHGEGLADLDADMAAALGLSPPASNAEDEDSDSEATPAPVRPLRVAIVGRPNVGKSTLVNALLGEDRMLTGPEPGLTRDAVAIDLDWGGRAVRLFDTAGLRRKSRIAEKAEELSVSDTVRAIRFAGVVVLVIDAEHPLEHQDLTIGDLITREGRAMVVAVNKWDLVADKQRLRHEIEAKVKDSLAQVQGVAVVPVSAMAETGLDRLMAAVADAHAIWNMRVATPDLNRWLREAMERHAPPASKGRRIKIRFITQPSTRPPTFVAFCQKAGDLPPDYVRYLVNSLRTAFGMPGVPIRFNLKRGDNPFANRKRR
jgi:GTP-binding protein